MWTAVWRLLWWDRGLCCVVLCAVACLSRLLDEVRETERQGRFGRAQPLPIFGEAMVDRDPPTRLMWLAFVVVLPLVV